MKKKKEPKVIVYHQHKDGFGQIFGKLHPVDAKHTKASTINAHVYTIRNST